MSPLFVKDRAILEQFDVNDPANMGRPLYWSLSNHIIAIEQMIAADEIQIAIQMLEQVPGWYRDNYPDELRDIRNNIYRQCYDQFDYASDHDEANFTKEEILAQAFSPYTYPRANVLAEDLAQANKNGKRPWIFEISPSHGWLPLGFAEKGLEFNFFGKNLNQKALDKIKGWLPPYVWSDSPGQFQESWLVCYEALEHMWNPHDLEQAAKKVGYEFSRIYLSTPKYTLGCGLPDWKTRRLGHVRTWTPNEFSEFARKSFPGFDWAIWPAHSMVLRGVRRGINGDTARGLP